MGRGRTTTGMFLVALIYCKNTSQSINLISLPKSCENGYYSLINALLAKFPKFQSYKSEIDAILNDCEQLMNLRGFIWHCKLSAEKEQIADRPDDAKSRRAAFWLNLAKNYVERYCYFICFNAYLSDPEDAVSFKQWCEKRNELFVELLGRNAGSSEDISLSFLQRFNWD
jgi:hypothetical protein